MKGRDKTLDVAKGISIILMTLTHLSFVYSYSFIVYLNKNYLMIFKMSLFILISGFLFSNNNSLKKFTLNKIDGLLKPVIVIITITGIISVLLSNNFTIKEIVFNFFNPIYKYYFPLWFIFSLFIALLLFRFIYEFYYQKRYYLLSCLIILMLVILAYFNIYSTSVSIVKLYTVLYFIQFLTIGAIVKKFNLLNIILRKEYFILSTISFIVICYFGEILNIQNDLYQNKIGNIITTNLASLTGVFSVLYIAKVLTKYSLISSILINISKASLFILGFHIIIGNLILYPLFNNLFNNKIVTDCTTFVFTIFSCYLIYFILSKTKYIKYIFLPIKTIK